MTQEERKLADKAFENQKNFTYHAYIDIAGDLIAGTLLSRIMFWFSEDKNGHSKIRVKKKDGLWLAKTREDWYKEIRISPKQYDRAVKILVGLGLVEKSYHRFNGMRIVHLRPIKENVENAIENWKEEWIANNNLSENNSPQLPKGELRNYPKVNSAITQRVNPITENTTEITTENKDYIGCCSSNKHTIDFQWYSKEQYDNYINHQLKEDAMYVIKNMNKNKEAGNTFYMILKYFFEQFQEHRHTNHPIIKINKLKEIAEVFYSIDDCIEFDDSLRMDILYNCIDQFFCSDRKNDYKIYIFSEKITFTALVGRVTQEGYVFFKDMNKTKRDRLLESW